MRRVEICGTQLTTKDTVHDALAAALELPEWYGRNLDALHDCLTQLRDVELVLEDVTLGLVSVERARTVYGVSIDPITLTVNMAETQQLRAEH